VRAAAQVSQGRGPLREEDRGGVRGQAVRHLVRYLGSPRDHSESIAVAGLVEDQGFLEQLKELAERLQPDGGRQRGGCAVRDQREQPHRAAASW
jgi:hypothetical protein